MQKRIWELDALRGLCVLGMVVIHFVYDLVQMYRIVSWELPAAWLWVQRWGGVLFLLISGVCVTLGRHPVRRGLTVFAGGLLCTAVTAGMYLLKLSGPGIIIYFGVLHCLGICMLLWHPIRKLPAWALAVLGLALVILGFWVETLPRAGTVLLVPLGLTPEKFASSDYFPLLPNFGFFLMGAVLGKTLYRSRQTLLPNVSEKSILVRFLLGVGKQSLWIYLLHQPLLNAICYLILMLKNGR